jgi:exodeoxyribonuclease VII large subunit
VDSQTTALSRQIYSVHKLTEKIKLLLEKNFPMVWVCGEISNLRIPSSGHAYFTLKDDKAQIAAVMFRGQMRQLQFELEDGLAIIGLGRISVYEPRGTFQIILEYVEPKGAGALQLAFEQLKQKLAREGLFDASHKTTLPFLPETIAVITSPTGAAIRDILHVVQRRFPNVRIEIVPVAVQGDAASKEITRALSIVNLRAAADVIILARGGGSLEDLAAFNTETVARAIFASSIPVISAVGHETDFHHCRFCGRCSRPYPLCRC